MKRGVLSAKFFKTIESGDKEKVEQLLRKTPNLILARNKNKLSPLMIVLYHQHFEIAELLLERMVVLSVHEAAATGKMKHLISSLARKPELVNAYSDDGFQPLGLAAYFGQKEAVEYLIKAGAGINSPSKDEMEVTPLQSAVAGGHLEITRLLLETGASPNARDRGGYTPLHVAAQRGDVGFVHSLLFCGADMEVRSKKKESPLDIAHKAGHNEVAKLLNSGITRRFRGSRLKR